MQIPGLDLEFAALAAPVPVWHAQVSTAQWRDAALAVRDEGGRLLALWAGSLDAAAADGVTSTGKVCMCAAYVTLDGAFWLTLPLNLQDGRWLYPDL
ncbi:MAG: Ni,Fe-hydrogenase III large subunit, partial [Betaproteobacteria bacterium]|nr:Ni,Fe-hydrogenase III large subunit [Betaproteobacteria bacterium]